MNNEQAWAMVTRWLDMLRSNSLKFHIREFNKRHGELFHNSPATAIAYSDELQDVLFHFVFFDKVQEMYLELDTEEKRAAFVAKVMADRPVVNNSEQLIKNWEDLLGQKND